MEILSLVSRENLGTRLVTLVLAGAVVDEGRERSEAVREKRGRGGEC